MTNRPVSIHSADMNSKKRVMTIRLMNIDASSGDPDATALYELILKIAAKTGDEIFDEACSTS